MQDPIQEFLALAQGTPAERDPMYFRTWQRVSVALQRMIRLCVFENTFESWRRARIGRRLTASSRSLPPSFLRTPSGGFRVRFLRTANHRRRMPHDRPRNADQARTVGATVARSGQVRIARRYAPVWQQDILRAAQKKPQRLAELLARESVLINALIDFGTMRDLPGRRDFRKRQPLGARVFGLEPDEFERRVLAEAGRALDRGSSGADDIGDPRILEDDGLGAARSPDSRVGGDEDGDHRRFQLRRRDA